MGEGVEARIHRVVCETFCDGDTSLPIDQEAPFVDQGLCDSMGLIELAAALEGEFDALRVGDEAIADQRIASIDAIRALLSDEGVS